MARRPSARRRIERLVEDWAPAIRAAFLEAIGNLTSSIEIGRVADAIEAGSIAEAIAAMHLDRAAFASLESAIRQTYAAGGTATAQTLPPLSDASGRRIVVRFDVANPRAEAWLRTHGGQLVTDIVDDQEVAIREALTRGMQAGENPRRVALDIAGRINRATGQREGGVVGLTSQQESFAARAQAELTGDDWANYFTRKRRDRRFDRQLRRYLEEGRRPPDDLVRRATSSYRNRLLQLRAENISRLESKGALHSAEDESFRQAVDSGALEREHVRRTWRHVSNENAREQHEAMDGQERGLDEPFEAPDGTRIMYPCDPSAPLGHTINCHCQLETRIDFVAQALARRGRR